MADHVIGERRREPRQPPSVLDATLLPLVPGTRVLDIVDTSAHGLRCRLAGPVRPGRPMTLRVPVRGALVTVSFRVTRCEVSRITRHGVQYDAAWVAERPWAP